MKKPLEITLVIGIGLLLGFFIHGLIEVIAIWVLANWLTSFFASITWANWLLIHLVFTILVEILGVALVFWIYRKRVET